MQSWVNLYGLASARIDVHRRAPFRSGATSAFTRPDRNGTTVGTRLGRDDPKRYFQVAL